MKIKPKSFELSAKKSRKSIKSYATEMKCLYDSEADAKERLEATQKDLAEAQAKLYAQSEWSVLLILQGMDTAGKDGLIKHVMAGVDPQGCEVTSFKAPNSQELAHDFLWRAHQRMPPRGRIGVFNRSYYEDVIVPSVHPEVLDTSRLPKSLRGAKNLVDHRCRDIVHFEKYMARQGTLILKFFLHLSREEQKKRLLARLETPEKQWKFNPDDMKERGYWAKFQKSYEKCLRATDHEDAPWYIIPADDKPNARLLVSKILLKRIEELKLDYPKVDQHLKDELKKAKRRLETEKT